MKKETLFSILKYLISLALGVGILTFIFQNTSIDVLKQQLAQVQVPWLFASAGLWLVSHYLRAIRWQMQLKAANYHVPKDNAYAAVLINYLMNLLIPRAGELARCSVILRTDKVPLTSVGTVVTERVLDVVLLLIFVLIGFFLSAEHISALVTQLMEKGSGKLWMLALLVVFGLIGIVFYWKFQEKLRQFAWIQKIEKIITDFLRAAISIKEVENPILYVVYSFSIWICYWLATYTLLKSAAIADDFIPQTSLLLFAYITNLIGALGVAAPSPGGTGTYHLAVISSFVLFHACPEVRNCDVGVSAAFVLHTFQMIFMPILAGSLAYLYLFLKDR
ncbi:MAG: lysylphosphatidylglycerol synthase transmembrane domain-containing protein [Bacteroidia bacterium]